MAKKVINLPRKVNVYIFQIRLKKSPNIFGKSKDYKLSRKYNYIKVTVDVEL